MVMPVYSPKGVLLANVCMAGRKDLKAAVIAARNAQADWAKRSAYNRSQILYRMAEMLESRRLEFINELQSQGLTKIKATAELNRSVDRLVYYAGWCDKYSAVFSSVNPVASTHHNFSVPEAMGVVIIFCPPQTPLSGLISLTAPVIAGGNACAVVASETMPLSALSFGEVLATSDVPAGLINLLSGRHEDLDEESSLHRDVNALVVTTAAPVRQQVLEKNCSVNVKRFVSYAENWEAMEAQGPYYILNTQEMKTTWHSAEQFSGAGTKY